MELPTYLIVNILSVEGGVSCKGRVVMVGHQLSLALFMVLDHKTQVGGTVELVPLKHSLLDRPNVVPQHLQPLLLRMDLDAKPKVS